MRIIILTLAALLSFFASAQPEPKTNDNTIIIYGSHNLNDFARFLVQNGYEIDTKDMDLGYVTTKPLQTKRKNAATHRIKVVKEDNELIVNSLVQLNTPYKKERSKHKYLEEKARVTGLPSAHSSAFDAAYEIALKYSQKKGGEVKTEKR